MIFAKIKIAIAAVFASIVAGLAIMLKLSQSKNKKLTEDNRVLEGNLEVKEEEMEDALDIKDFEIDREKTESKIQEEANENLDAAIADIDEIPDGEEFEVKL